MTPGPHADQSATRVEGIAEEVITKAESYLDRIADLEVKVAKAHDVIRAARHWLKVEYPHGAHNGYEVDEPAARLQDALRAYDRAASDQSRLSGESDD